MKPTFYKITFGLLMTASIVFAQMPTNGLVAYYPFNGNANDDSGNGNDGTVNGAALSSDRFGNANSAYYFDGEDGIIVKNNPSICIGSSNEITVSVWANRTGNQNVSHILGKRGNSSDIEYQFGYCSIEERCSGSNLSFNGGNFFGGSGYSILTNTWNHYVGIFKNNQWMLYVNGNLISSDTGNITSTKAYDLLIGGSGIYEKWYGYIDDIAIYNRALSAQEILQLTNINTGLSESTVENTMKIYPNPASDDLIIETNQITVMSGHSIEVLDTQGQMVFCSAINQIQFSINLASWTKNCLYVVKLLNAQNVVVESQKVIVE